MLAQLTFCNTCWSGPTWGFPSQPFLDSVLFHVTLIRIKPICLSLCKVSSYRLLCSLMEVLSVLWYRRSRTTYTWAWSSGYMWMSSSWDRQKCTCGHSNEVCCVSNTAYWNVYTCCAEYMLNCVSLSLSIYALYMCVYMHRHGQRERERERERHTHTHRLLQEEWLVCQSFDEWNFWKVDFARY